MERETLLHQISLISDLDDFVLSVKFYVQKEKIDSEQNHKEFDAEKVIRKINKKYDKLKAKYVQ